MLVKGDKISPVSNATIVLSASSLWPEIRSLFTVSIATVRPLTGSNEVKILRSLHNCG